MKFTDTFIKRPVLAIVVSIMLLMVGVLALDKLNVRQYPEMQNAVITVSTAYVGADADLIRGFITVPLERKIASAEGIDYLTSTSVPGFSIIQATLTLDADTNESLIQIQEKVSSASNELPTGSENPTISLAVGQTTSAMYMSFSSDILNNNQITDYISRKVQPLIGNVPGVQSADILGARTFAMRVWLKPERMAALNITATEVRQQLAANNVLAPVGKTRGNLVNVDFAASTDLHTAEEFEQLIIRENDNAIIRLQDIADVELGSESYDSLVEFNGKQAIFIGINVATDANLLSTIEQVRERFPKIQADAPSGLNAEIVYDSTKYVEQAIEEVIMTILEAVIIVVVVIFLFLGSLRTVLIPAVAVPLSLLGGCAIMWAMGFTFNLMTLLAMVLAIGMVVDDAIIVLENIHRHIEEGKSPRDASIIGTRELVGPVIAMTITLVAVYIPIGFRGGLTGALFTEFAFALAGSVLVSGIVALTLSPVMCAYILKSHETEGWFSRKLEDFFKKLDALYKDLLRSALRFYGAILAFGLLVFLGSGWLFMNTPQDLAPKEDQGFILAILEGPANASIDYSQHFSDQLTDTILSTRFPASQERQAEIRNELTAKAKGNRGELSAEEQTELDQQITEALAAEQTNPVDNLFMFIGSGPGSSPGQTNAGFGGIILKPSTDREITGDVYQQTLDAKTKTIPGMRTSIFQPPSLPSPGGFFPIDVAIGTNDSVEDLNKIAQQVLGKAYQSGKFMFVLNDLKIDKPRKRIVIDRDKAATLGISMQQIGAELASLLAGGHVNRFSIGGQSYKVIPQVIQADRLNADQLTNYYVRSGNGDLVSMGGLVTLEDEVEPQSLSRFQQLNSTKITGMPAPGVSESEALRALQDIADEALPAGYVLDYAGQSRQTVKEGNSMLLTFLMALILIYLVLVAQFNSFVDPIIMIVTVPMAICGALIFVHILSNPLIGFMAPGMSMTLNIFATVGLVTLVGVITKHGILIVEFANELQSEGLQKRIAILEACTIRLRPVLMTTVSLVVAMVPLLIATGAGSGARFSMGIVIASGMTLGTLFTLFVVPAVYLLIGRNLQGTLTQRPQAEHEPA